MNDPKDKSALLRETAIFEYVSGDMSDSAKRNFEKMMESDSDLQEAVDAEIRLRSAMKQAGDGEPVSMGNFDALLARIDAEEKAESSPGIVDPVEDSDNLHQINPWTAQASKPRYYAMAASFAIVAVIAAVFLLDVSSPDYETLSDKPASESINFTQLTESGRLAKFTFSENLSQAQITDLLSQYRLTTFEAGAAANERYVVAELRISDDDVTKWRAESGVVSVELFVAQGEE
ncbi:MAG: hypothetical protein AAF431_13280 [Pseudomonadota bacterium]